MRKYLPFIGVGLAFLVIAGLTIILPKKTNGIYSAQDLALINEIDTLNKSILQAREQRELAMLTLGKEKMTDILLNPEKYYDCTYSGCTSLLAIGSGH